MVSWPRPAAGDTRGAAGEAPEAGGEAAGPGELDPSATLDRLLALRPAAEWERIEQVNVVGAALAVIRTPSPTGDAHGDDGAARVAGRRASAVVTTDRAVEAAGRLLETTPARELTSAAHARSAVDPQSPADADGLLPFPHAALLWDGSRLEIELDPLGAWPLYLRRLPGGLAVGTSALTLARLAPSCDFDPEGVAELLTFGQLLGSRTLYAGIEALPPGARRIDSRSASRRERLLLASEPEPRRSLDQAADQILAAIDAAVGMAPVSSLPGLLLSGGLDSRLVLALLVRSGQPVRAFTFGQPGCADEKLARRATSVLGVRHRVAAWRPQALEQVLDHAVALTDGHVPALHFHGCDLLATMRGEASAEWNGFAGDAILGGSFAHPRYALPGPPSLEARLFAAFNRILRPQELPAVLAAPAAAELRFHPRAALAAALAATPAAAPAERARRFLLDQRVGRLAAPGLALDRHYLPVITPYAHAPVLAAMQRLRMAERRYGRAMCRIFVRHFPPLAAIPWQRTGARPGVSWPWAAAVRAGGRLWGRAGRGAGAIADYPAWLDGPLAGLRRSLCMSPSLQERALFAARGLERLGREQVRTGKQAALAGVVMALAVAAELLDGRRQAPGQLELPQLDVIELPGKGDRWS